MHESSNLASGQRPVRWALFAQCIRIHRKKAPSLPWRKTGAVNRDPVKSSDSFARTTPGQWSAVRSSLATLAKAALVAFSSNHIYDCGNCKWSRRDGLGQRWRGQIGQSGEWSCCSLSRLAECGQRNQKITTRIRRALSDIQRKVALAPVRGERTLAELVQQFDVHPNPATEWRRQLQKRAAEVFGAASRRANQIFIRRARRSGLGEPREMIYHTHMLSVSRRPKLLAIGHRAWLIQPVDATP